MHTRGKSSLIAEGWEKISYPVGISPRKYLIRYGAPFETTEVHAAFCQAPVFSTVWE